MQQIIVIVREKANENYIYLLHARTSVKYHCHDEHK